jgi:radical SAM family uncharacterized protein/radical SAM-linked protein
MGVRQQLFQILPSVRRPSRYIGNEWNRIVKDPASVDLNMVLAFPDGYEIGMSYPGFQILYHILNRRRDVCCERVYAPFPDMEQALRDKQLSLFSLETFRPLREFDVIGFTLQYELHATNILTILDLAGIPVWAKDRSDHDPLIIAGGPCAYNSEPIAPFMDAILLGDGEKAIHAIVDAIIDAKRRDLPKTVLLESLARIPGMYVPRFYHPSYENGRFAGINVDAGFPLPVVASHVKYLSDDCYPEAPMVPVSEVSHNRLQVEIMRGCTRGCRFCQAGMIYRPLRDRSVQSIAHQVSQSLTATGYEELSLVSLSSSDYRYLEELLNELDKTVRARNVSLSFPSLRPDTFTETMAKRASAGRTSGLTIAPEAGTARLRAVINKAGDEDDVYRACTIALDHGWRKIKLYFMIGLPTETDDDLLGIGEIVHGILRLPGSHRLQGVTLSASPFVPKAQTSFQRVPQIMGEELYRKATFLRNHLPRRKVKVDWRDPKIAEIEGIIARGDRRISQVLYRAWHNGARFCGWSDHFRYDLYREALRQENISPGQFLGGYSLGQPLPWGHLSKGIRSEFFDREVKRSLDAFPTDDCRNGCTACGLPPKDCFRVPVDESTISERIDLEIPPILFESTDSESCATIRIKYSVRDLLRFLSHLEIVRVWERTFRRSDLPVVFSEGFRSRPRLSFSPPRAVGIASEAEYLDARLGTNDITEIQDKLSKVLPDGLEIVEIAELDQPADSLDKAIDCWEYNVTFPHPNPDLDARCDELLQRGNISVLRTKPDRKSHHREHTVDIRPSITSLIPRESSLLITLNKPGPVATINEILDQLKISQHHRDITRTAQWIITGDDRWDPITAGAAKRRMIVETG